MNVGTAECHVCGKRHPWSWWPSKKRGEKVPVFDNHYRPPTTDEYFSGVLYPTCEGSLTYVERSDTMLMST